MDPFTQFITKLGSGFNALPSGKKMSLLVAVVISLSCIIALVYFTNQTDYRVLFSNLATEDAGSIVGKLQEKKIPYRISPDGTTISVPAEKVAELRLEMATAGLPHGGGVGFEIFDNKSIGATEFEQQLNYRRALQGELVRTINALDEIQQSRVHLAIPKDSLFIDQQKKTTASVSLKLKPGRSLRQAQIDGIAHLVASSIEGMNAEDVMIIDSLGNILSKNTGDSKLAKMSGAQVDYQRGIEKDLSSRIQSLLENVVGAGKAVVRVSTDLDFRMTEKTEETYDPESPVVRSTQKQSEKSTAPTAGKSAGLAASAENEKVDETVNYEINRVTSKTVMPVGEIKKMSIAVLVDGTYTKNKKGVEEYHPRDKKEIDSLENLVRKSAGFSESRGDQVAVTNMPFQRGEGEGETAGGAWYDKILLFAPLLKYGVVMVAVALLFLFVLRPLVRGVTAGVRIKEVPVPQLAPAMAAATGAVNEPPRTLSIDELKEKTMTETEITKELASADAKKFAELLRNWLK